MSSNDPARRPSLHLTRRQALKTGVAGAAGVAAASSVAGATTRGPRRIALKHPAGPRPDLTKPAGTDLIPKIKNIVIVMLENQSFDGILGTLTEAGSSAPRGNGLSWATPGARPTNTNPDGKGGSIRSFKMPSTAQLDAQPWQTWGASWTQFTGSPIAQTIPTDPAALNQGFVISNSGPISMGYFGADQLTFTHSLAQTFPIADNWHCSVPAQTYPNRRYMMAGTSMGLLTTSFSVTSTMPANGTIFEALMDHNISWKNYFCDNPSSLIWGGHASVPGFFDHLTSISTFFSDAAAGTLPAVSLVDPRFDFASGENPQDLQHADAFLHSITTALMKSPQWKHTLMLWTVDEHGGYYDHVPMAQVPDPGDVAPILSDSDWHGSTSLATFGWTGFRVPTGVVSPYAKTDYVSTQLYDHTSIMKLIEQKWNLPSFTARDEAANSPLDMVDLNAKPAFLKPPKLAKAPVDTKGVRVSTGIGSDTYPTADEVTYPDTNKMVAGKGKLRRQQFYTNRDGSPTAITTPYYEMLEASWSS